MASSTWRKLAPRCAPNAAATGTECRPGRPCARAKPSQASCQQAAIVATAAAGTGAKVTSIPGQVTLPGI
jgi:hypothetical protein